MYFPGDPIPTELEPGSIGQKYFVSELGYTPCIEYRDDLPKSLRNKVSSNWRNTKGNHLANVKAIQTTWGVFPIDPALDRYGFAVPPPELNQRRIWHPETKKAWDEFVEREYSTLDTDESLLEVETCFFNRTSLTPISATGVRSRGPTPNPSRGTTPLNPLTSLPPISESPL